MLRTTCSRPFHTQHLHSERCWLLQPGVIFQFHLRHCHLVYFIRAISKAQGSGPAKELSQGVVTAEACCSKGLADTEWETEESLSSKSKHLLKTPGNSYLARGPCTTVCSRLHIGSYSHPLDALLTKPILHGLLLLLTKCCVGPGVRMCTPQSQGTGSEQQHSLRPEAGYLQAECTEQGTYCPGRMGVGWGRDLTSSVWRGRQQAQREGQSRAAHLNSSVNYLISHGRGYHFNHCNV